MMTTRIEALERKRLREVAQEYEDQGYEVILEPDGSQLPGFLSGFQPDLIACNGQENVLVEVRSRSTLVEGDDLTALTEAVSRHQGWRFELVVTNPEHPPVVDVHAQPLGHAEIQTRIEQTSQLLSEGLEDAAALLYWSAAEAALRLIARQQDVELESDHPDYILKQLYTLGLLNRSDYDLLREGIRLRNHIVHGVHAPGSRREFVAKALPRLRELLKTESS